MNKFSKTLLAAALVFAIAGCGEDDDKQQTNDNKVSDKPVVVKATKKAKTYTGEEQKTETEKRYRALYGQLNQIYKDHADNSPVMDSMFAEIVSYQAGEQESTASTKFKFKLAGNNKSEIEVNMNHKLNHADELAAENKIAVIESSLVDISGENTENIKSIYDKYADKIHNSTELLADGSAKSTFAIDPINVEEKNLNIKGLKIVSEIFEPETAQNPIFPYKASFEFGGLTESNSELSAFNANALRDNKGNSSIEISPIKFKIDEKNSLEISNPTTVKQSNLKYDDESDLILGNTSFKLSKLILTSDDLPSQIVISEITSNTSDNVKNGIYSFSSDIGIKPETDFAKDFAQIEGLKINNIKLKFDGNGLSAKSIQELRSFFKSPDDAEKLTNNIFNDLATNQGKIVFDLNADTAAGDAKLAFNLAVKKGAKSFSQEELDSIKDPDQAIKFISDRFDFNADIKIPKLILEKTNAEAMVLMFAGQYVKEEGGVYSCHIELKPEGIIINGSPLKL